MMSPPVDAGSAIAQTIGFHPVSSSANSGWHNVALYEWNGVIEQCDLHFGKEPLLALQIGGDALAVGIDGRWVKEQSHPGLLTFIPVSESATYRLSGKVRSITAHLNARCFDTEAGEEIPHILSNRLRFQCAFKDDLLSAAVRGLADEMAHPHQLGSLYADSIATTVGIHLLRRCTASSGGSTNRPLLSRRALRIAIDLIEESIETGTSLEALASAVDLSRTYFAKAFKVSTGLSPHSYLTSRRIDRARALLAETDETIAQIAISSGFSSQAHFTEYFRRATGLTPFNFKRSRK
jgi:AraC family transcriptional regulator